MKLYVRLSEVHHQRLWCVAFGTCTRQGHVDRRTCLERRGLASAQAVAPSNPWM